MTTLIQQMPLLAIAPWIQPLWIVAVAALVALALLLGTYYALVLVLPKVAAVARTTAKEAVLQPIFWVLLLFGSGAIITLHCPGTDAKGCMSDPVGMCGQPIPTGRIRPWLRSAPGPPPWRSGAILFLALTQSFSLNPYLRVPLRWVTNF